MSTHLITRADIEALSRRPGPGPMVPNPQPGPTPQQIVAQQQAHEQALRKREETINRSKKPVDRDLPEGLEALVIGDGVQRYNKMRELERKLDATMMRKRLDVQDSVYRDGNQNRTLRLWVSNTVKNQPWQYQAGDRGSSAYDYNSGTEASFRVKVEGRLLDDDEEDPADPSEKQDAGRIPGEDEEQEQAAEADGERPLKRQKTSPSSGPTSSQPRKKLSHFFKSISIDFDRPRSLQPDNYTRIDWKRPEHAGNTGGELPKEADFDRLEFERKADENINISINLVKDEYPERYRLAEPLAQLLDMKEAGRTEVLMGIWEYIKSAGVRMDEDKKHIHCDHRLQGIFNQETLFFPHLPNAIRPFLSDPPPITIPYTIRVDAAFHSSPTPTYTIYDIPITLPTPLAHSSAALLSPALTSPTSARDSMATLRRIATTDDQLTLLVARLGAGKAKHDFLASLASDPARFVRRWLDSQKRDLDVVLGKGAWGEEDAVAGRGRAVWESKEVGEGIGVLLARGR